MAKTLLEEALKNNPVFFSIPENEIAAGIADALITSHVAAN